MKSRFFKFKFGQFFWIALVSFFSYYGIFSVGAFSGPLISFCVIGSFLLPRYIYVKSINWEKGDHKYSVDILRDLLVCIAVYVVVFLPEWWFTKEIYTSFGDPVIFKLKNYADTDYHTTKELHKSYGIIIVALITILDNWMVYEETRKNENP